MIVVQNSDLSFEVIKPIKIRQTYGKETLIETFPELFALAQELEAADDPLSDASLGLIWQKSKDYLESIGYSDDKFRKRKNIIFRKEKAVGIVQNNSIRVDSCRKYNNLTTIDFVGRECFATVRDSEIISLAAAYPADDGAYEICVETVPEHRKRGYASSNVRALSDYLIGRGHDVRYLCAETNAKSSCVAKRAGFFEIGKSYDYIVRRKER